MKINIFKYISYRKYLKEYYQRQKKSSRFFSFRYFAGKAGFTSPNILKLVMDGKRNLSRESLEKFSRTLGLDKTEARYFKCMVLFDQSTKSEEKQKYFQELLSYKKTSRIKIIQSGQYEYLSRWFPSVIREIIQLPGAKFDPEWIARRANPPLTAREAASALKLMERLDLLRKNEKGELEVLDEVLSTGPEVQFLAAALYHREMIRLAGEAIDRFPSYKREISALTLRTSEQCFNKIKEKIQNLEQEILALAVQDKNSDKIYQINFQLFPLIREIKEKNHIQP
jgi:uncharacterized protein (TIGR02147 family)